MAVSKRTRFEVLRRDDYTCRYCRSTDGVLTVDHVTPVALGGSDKPDNLVSACKACLNRKLSPWDVFRYMCGISWNVITEMQEAARALVTDGVND